MLKKSINKHVFSTLKEQQADHIKIRDICYDIQDPRLHENSSSK